jgi:hypothetical protein
MPSVSDFRAITFAFTGTYATGGMAFDPGGLGLDHPIAGYTVLPQPKAGYVFDYDGAAKKIKAYRQTAATGALAEVANGTDITAASPIPVFVVPKTT